ncbi:MAG: class I SAM-dependent methyltransferase family protein, partial [Thermoplasmata archaeon]|nr:class I SAM-dependent methyltransferase family protein [Thermoplasmata archaeon]
MLAIRVPSQNAEPARLLMTEHGILDKHHRIYNADGYTEIPALERPLPEVLKELEKLSAEIVDSREYDWRETFKDVHRDILAAIQIPENLKPLIPKRWEQLGHVLVLKIDPELNDWLEEIANTYAKFLDVDTVLRDTGGITGKFREPVMDLLLGETTETIHLENQVKFCLDAARLMFSSGNVDERIRMATVPKPGEVVVDMFAGIGYFTLPMAVHSSPEKIIAHEINPVSFGYLKMNIGINKVGSIVRPVLGDCMDAEENVADRVVMGYVGTTHEYLPKAMRI